MKGETMKRNLVTVFLILLCAVMLFSACSADKGPAQLAIKAAEEAVNAAKAEAGKIVPDQIDALESALASAKEKLSKGEIKAALEEAQGLIGKAKDVVAAAKAKKDELIQKWTDLSQGLPKMVEAVQSRVDILSQAKKLPADMTAEKLAEVKSGLAAVKEDWAKAQESFKSGNMADAISVATTVKEKAVKAMEALGMTVPQAAKS
jgi:hypothetical protein